MFCGVVVNPSRTTGLVTLKAPPIEAFKGTTVVLFEESQSEKKIGPDTVTVLNNEF